MAKLVAEVTGGTRFWIGLGRFGLLLLGEGGGGSVGSKGRGGGGLGSGLQVPDLVHNSKGVDHSVKVMGKGGDDGHAGKVIIEVVQSEACRGEGLDDPDLLINPVDNTIQGLRGVLPDREEVLVGLEPWGRGGVDEGALESVPDLDRVFTDIPDID